MALKEKLTTIKTAIENIKESLYLKGIITSTSSKLEDLPELINDYTPSGSSEDYVINTCDYMFYSYVSNSRNNLTNDYYNDIIYKHIGDYCSYYRTFGNYKASELLEFDFKVKPYSNNTYYTEESFIGSSRINGTVNIIMSDPSIRFNSSSMFKNCYVKKITINHDTLNIGYGASMFYNCSYLNELPILDINNCISMTYMFYNCKAIQNIKFQGRPNKGSFGNLSSSALVMTSTFYNCTNLKSITGLDITNVTDFNATFYYCSNLISLDFTGTENVNANIDLSNTKLGRDALMSMLDSLPQLDHDITLTLGSKLIKNLSDDDIVAFLLKGYTLA